ncbi:lysophospholipid acyltransferase family protein [Sphingomonas sp.]|uniref:lysophospholipid acyltransferase family protein n=1 Tax=Sphingomonas sp. TaxID=28214 RepID=UPI002C976555|nr:lysophospholipid acyltransferase family protein [Sphingomonas sp.]HWK36122.1 lysophospholipid acyltransferase family protein [Sphingomonas sp.]
MTARLRTIAFVVAFYGGSVFYVLATPTVALFGEAAMRYWVLAWVRFHAGCAKYLLGVASSVTGAPPAGQALIAAKHQSFFETFELIRILGGPAVVMRREFGRIPLWGWAARRYGVIMIDRAGSAAALRGMMRAAAAAKAQGRSVVIFPEGTRVKPGEAPPLRPGFAGLYRALALQVVPVAIDSGRLWPKSGAKRAGIVTFAFGDPIPPGLPRAEVEARAHEAINALER